MVRADPVIQLGDWQSGTTILVSSLPHGDGTVTEVWRAELPASAEPEQFLRLKVEG